MNVAAFALEVFMNLPSLIKAGVDVSNIINHTADTITQAQDEGRDITDAEWEESNDIIAELQAERDEATKDVS